MSCKQLTVAEYLAKVAADELCSGRPPNPEFSGQEYCEETCGICCLPVCGANLLQQSNFLPWVTEGGRLPYWMFGQTLYPPGRPEVQMFFGDIRLVASGPSWTIGPQLDSDGRYINQNQSGYRIFAHNGNYGLPPGWSCSFGGSFAKGPEPYYSDEYGEFGIERFYQCVDGVLVDRTLEVLGPGTPFTIDANRAVALGYCDWCAPYNEDLNNVNDGSVTCSGFESPVGTNLSNSWSITKNTRNPPLTCTAVSSWSPPSSSTLGVILGLGIPWPTSYTDYVCNDTLAMSSCNGVWRPCDTCSTYDCGSLRVV